jgi:hypothetical protein
MPDVSELSDLSDLSELSDDEEVGDEPPPTRLRPTPPMTAPTPDVLVAAGWQFVAGSWWRPTDDGEYVKPRRQPPAPERAVPDTPEPRRFQGCEHIATFD